MTWYGSGPVATPGVQAPDSAAVPPPGPGVQPPFAAPPIDGDRTRVWVGLGVGAAALVLCCVAGIAGIGGLMVTGVQAINEQAHATVRHYLDALVREDYAGAYAVLCDTAQRRESQRQFAERVSRGPRVVRYTLRETEIAEQIVVPADVSFVTGVDRELRFVLDQDTTDNRLEVCDVK